MVSGSFDVVSAYAVVYKSSGSTWIVRGCCINWFSGTTILVEKNGHHTYSEVQTLPIRAALR